MKTVETIVANTSQVHAKIQDILNRGLAAKFTNKYTGVVKIVTEWNLDDMGDLEGVYSTGKTKYVCPDSVEYDISEIELKDIP